MKELECHYWWHVAKRNLVSKYLEKCRPPPAKILEVGVGAGGNLLHFKKLGYEVKGFDIMPEAIQYCKGRGLNDVSVHDIAQPWPARKDFFDVVVMLDVLEHLERPVESLRFASRALKANGIVILTVPACPYIMGPWDKALGHQRRYSMRMLKSEFKEAGLDTADVAYWNLFSLPPALIVRGMQKLFPQSHSSEFPRIPKLLNTFLLFCAYAERKILRNRSFYYGLSIMGVFTKPA